MFKLKPPLPKPPPPEPPPPEPPPPKPPPPEPPPSIIPPSPPPLPFRTLTTLFDTSSNLILNSLRSYKLI